jgi:hypothetical protein
MAKNKIITSQGNVQFINSKGKVINMHPMHCYAVYENDTVSFLFIYMKDYSGQAFFASQYEDLEVNGETYDNMDDLKDAINYAFAKAGAQARTEIVDELPEDPFTNTIYLLPKEHGEGYDEYIWNEDEGWQLIGDTDIEFERYLQIADFNPYSAATKDYIDLVSGETVTNHNDIVFLSGAVDTEISARTDADTALSGAIDTVASDLADETTARTAADTALQNNINTVNGRVDAEQIARAQADTFLSGAVDSVSGAVDTEVSARTAADEALDSKIDTVSGDVISETSRAEGAEIALGGRIDNETTARTAADSALQSAINNETSARTAADEAIDAKIVELSGSVETLGDDKADKANAVASAEYVSSSTTIDLKNISGDVISQVDASDFIIDGMVDDVKVENGYLVITFNTDAGKQDIQIPLTSIFDPSNYYDKTAVDNIVSGLNDSIDTKLAISDFNTYSGDVETALGNKVETSVFTAYSASVETELGNKFDASAITAYSTSSEVTAEIEAAVSGKVDTVDFETFSGNVETELGNKFDASAITAYSTSVEVTAEIEAAVSGKADADDVYTKSEVYTKTEVDTAISQIDLSEYYTSAETDSKIAEAVSGKVDTSDFETFSGDVETALSGKVNNFFALAGQGGRYNLGLMAVDENYNIIYNWGEAAFQTDGSIGLDPIGNLKVWGKVDESAFTAYSASVETALGLKADLSALTEDERVWGEALNDLNSRINTISGDAISSGDVQTQIDNSISGKVDTTDFETFSGETDSRLTEDEEVTAAGLNALNDKFDGLKLKKLTQSQYDALSPNYDASTLYVIVN